MLDLKNSKQTDPIQRNVESGLDSLKGCTPFDPPGALDEDKKSTIPFDEMSELLKMLMDEHKAAIVKLDAFEKAIVDFKTNGFRLTPEINTVFGEFFKYFDNHILAHNEKEDKVLFPLLNEKLMNSGEHSVGENPTTAIDIMEDDHVRFIQLGTLTFNLLGLTTRIRDTESRNFIYDTAYNTGRELIELLRLHIYREDYTLFPLAHKLISNEEFKVLLQKTKKFEPQSDTHSCSSC